MRFPSSDSEGQADMSARGMRATGYASLGNKTKRPMTSGGWMPSTLTREADPAAARSLAWSSANSSARARTNAAIGPAMRSGRSSRARWMKTLPGRRCQVGCGRRIEQRPCRIGRHDDGVPVQGYQRGFLRQQQAFLAGVDRQLEAEP